MFKRIVAWFRSTYASIKEAWRDIKELSYPYSYSDTTWTARAPEEYTDAPAQRVAPSSAEQAECGRCTWCNRSVWYHVVYTSAGYPVAVLLCEYCTWDLLQTSPNIHTYRITFARSKWLKRNYPHMYGQE